MKKSKHLASNVIIGIIIGVAILLIFSDEDIVRILIFGAVFVGLSIPSLMACFVSLAVAKFTGYKLSSFDAYWFKIKQNNGKLSFHTDASNFIIPRTIFYPDKREIGSIETVMVLIFNIVTYAIGTIASFVIYDITKDPIPFSLAIVFAVTLLNATVLPFDEGCPNNLSVIKEVLARKERAVAQNNHLKIMHLRSIDVRFKDMDEYLFEEFSREALGERMYYLNQVLRMQYFTDTKRFEDEVAVVDSIIDSPIIADEGDLARGALRMDKALCLLLMGASNEAIEDEYNHADSEAFKEKCAKKSCVHAVGYAYELLYKNNCEKADEHLKLFYEYVDNNSKQTSERERDWVAMIKEEYKKRK